MAEHTGYSPPTLHGSSVLGSLTSESPELTGPKTAMIATAGPVRTGPDRPVVPPMGDLEQADIETVAAESDAASHDSALLQLAAQQPGPAAGCPASVAWHSG